MKTAIQVIGTLALVCGLLIALYAWQERNMANAEARQQAEARNVGKPSQVTMWMNPTIPVEDRALGMAFGLGLSFLGAFGLYAQLRMPEQPAS